MKQKALTLIVLVANLMSPNLFAGTMGSEAHDWTWFGTFSAGAIWPQYDDASQTIFLTPEIEKTYVSDHSTSSLFEGEIFVGGQKSFSQMLQGQLGLALSATSNANLRGIIWDDSDPLFANHLYSYKIQHSRVAAKGKLLLDRGYWVMPWVSVSLGVAFNHNHSYINTPIIFQALPNSNFASHTHTAFSYTAGAGVQKAFGAHWQLGLGYEFSDFGKNQLGRAIDQTLGSGLSLNHVHANAVLANITFVA